MKLILVSIIALFGFNYVADAIAPAQDAIAAIQGTNDTHKAGTFSFGDGQTVDSYLNESRYFNYNGK